MLRAAGGKVDDVTMDAIEKDHQLQATSRQQRTADVVDAIENGPPVKCQAVKMAQPGSSPVSHSTDGGRTTDLTAVSKLQKLLGSGNSLIDRLLDKAERCWMDGDLRQSLQHYDDALELSREAGDIATEGMVLAGKGCALASSEQYELLLEALECYKRSKQLASSKRLPKQVAFMDSLINGVKESLDDFRSTSVRHVPNNNDSVETATKPRSSSSASGRSRSHNRGSSGSSSTDANASRRPAVTQNVPSSQLLSVVHLPAFGSENEQRLWQLGLVYQSRVLDNKSSRVVMWQLSAHLMQQLILGRPAPPLQDIETCVISYTRKQSLKISHKVADLLGLAYADVSTRMAKTTESTFETAATVYVRTESLIAKIHAKFDADNDGYLSYDETRLFLTTIHRLHVEEYNAFCRSIGAEPTVGIAKDTLLNFYLTCEPNAVVEEFGLLSEIFSRQREHLADDKICDNDTDLKDPSHEYMVQKIYAEFDSDGDGLLSFDDFSALRGSLLSAAYCQRVFEAMCEDLDVQPALGLNVASLMKWYANEASADQVHLDYGTTVLGLTTQCVLGYTGRNSSVTPAPPTLNTPDGKDCSGLKRVTASDLALKLEESSHGHLTRGAEISRLAHEKLGQTAPSGRKLTKSEKNRRKKQKAKEKQRERKRREQQGQLGQETWQQSSAGVARSGADHGAVESTNVPKEEQKAESPSHQAELDDVNAALHHTSTSSSTCSNGSGSIGIGTISTGTTHPYDDQLSSDDTQATGLELDIGLGLGEGAGAEGAAEGQACGVIGDGFSQATAARAANSMQAETVGGLGSARQDNGSPPATASASVSDEIADEMEQGLETNLDALLNDDSAGMGGLDFAGGGAPAGDAETLDNDAEASPVRTTPASLNELVGIVRAELGLSDTLAPKQVLSKTIDFVETKPPTSVIGLRGQIEWAVVELLGIARAKELGCCKEPKAGGKPPEDFLCPISCELMGDPVTTLAGNTYEKVHIMAWFRTHKTDPLTNSKLSSTRLVPNNILRSQISAWMEAACRTRDG